MYDLPQFADTDHFSHAEAKEILSLYARTLSDLGYEPVPYPELGSRVGGNVLRGARYASLNHALWMCEECQDYIDQGRWAKAHRWIGMIQGLLFSSGVFSIYEIKSHNRSAVV